MTLRKYRVVSGQMDRIIEAETMVDAAAEAVRMEHESDSPAHLSEITEVMEVLDGPRVFKTETVCRAAGVWKFQLPST